ncbi:MULTISPECIES: hypothetical protein [Bradyrhizobium]|uniref:DUF2878 domain-containing protein n=1 Tax=Bradyrhizobium ottawaense TaxID=931866 RepID=A0ABV4G3N9_9BRAD|nr:MULTISPECIES: hypothetical protein [Bradyrhizobium]MBR1292311.1 hypothetical protein [Bradyrhizobium ottawaense]MBR1365434.1 hypothetical protein [Bradyrhizobium ottawaense]MDA9415782.1 hypothetical protein [Bradyrhizobium sp. CCBAU 25360]MDA9446644.1 hypothetical protein [Bradyrhizobium sp. CCBAU 21360]MDA9458145.1 hypothetical protein [Bradyrhizobium sp. CCBAU 21359]
MALGILPSGDDRSRLHPVAPRLAPMFCFALLTASCALASFAFACATPFAAFAVIAAAMLPQRPALLVVTGAWLVNQIIGFGVLHYPVDASTIAWGFVIGAAALLATAAASAVLGLLPQGRTPLALPITLIAAYGIYEIALLAATPFLGGEGAFTAAIVTRIALTCAVWLAGLVAICEIVRLVDPAGRKRAMSA